MTPDQEQNLKILSKLVSEGVMTEAQAEAEFDTMMVAQKAEPQPLPDAELGARPQYESATAGQAPQVPAQIEPKYNALGLPDEAPVEYPEMVGNKPALPRDLLMAYKTRSLPYDQRMAVEQALSRGEYAIPEGQKLRIEKNDETSIWSPSTYGEWASGDVRNQGRAGNLDELLALPELRQGGADLLAGLQMTTMSTDEKLQALKANYPDLKIERDFYNNPIITSAIDGKQVAIPAGMDASDAIGIGKSVATEAVLAAATGGIGQLRHARHVGHVGKYIKPFADTVRSSRWGGTLATGAKEAGIEAVNQGLDVAAGGSFDELDVGVGGVLGGAFHQGAKMLNKGAVAPTSLANAIERVQESPNSPESMSTLRRIYAEDTVLGDDILAKKGLALTDEGLKVQHRPLDEVMVKAGKGDKVAQAELADVMEINQAAVDAAEKLGVKDLMPLTVLANKADPATKEVMDNVSKITKEAKLDNDLPAITETLLSEMKKFDGTTDFSKVNREVTETMDNIVNKASM
jgi:hypothetical protein